MRLSPPLLAGFVAAIAACRSEDPRALEPVNERTTSAVEQDAIELFDGRTLAGWDGDPRFWSVEDGAIVGRSTRENPCERTTYLIWRGGEVRDFELSLEFRLRGGNSGVQFRSRALEGWQVAGFQADLEDGPSWTGCLYDQDGLGVVARRGELVVLGSALAQPVRVADGEALLAGFRRGEWHRYTIRARGPEVELAIDGVRTCQVVDLRPEARRSGTIALQLHEGPPMTVEFRNLRLVELAGAPPEPEPIAEPAVAPQTHGSRPQWIWTSSAQVDGDSASFVRHVELRFAPVKATFRAAADNHGRFFVNGALVKEHDDWSEPFEVEVSQRLREGDNEIAFVASNDGGPAAAWVELIATSAEGKTVRLVSDASWSAAPLAPGSMYGQWTPTDFQSTRAGPPYVYGSYGMAPWGPLSALLAAPVPPVEEHALEARAITVPDGFSVELLYSVPKDEQGSWVALCEDDRGRLYASDQYGALYRIVPPALGSDGAAQVERVPVEIGRAQGLCWAFDSLYVVVSDKTDRPTGLYRVRDTDADGELDLVTLLREFDGSGEHGPHAVVLGPAGHLWIVGGNHTKLPEPIDVYRLPKTWGEDLLLPRIEDPNGHAVGIRAPGGWIVRTDENAERWELWAGGFRNAYDLAFDEEGEVFTFDSDMEWDVGLPWYRPARICHVPSGAEFGWRSGSGKWPADYPDSLPAVVDIGLASPTGVVFGTSAAFPPKYRRALFALDWAYGTIYAVHLEPDGASYTGMFEKFATGKPFPVTDVVISRDGAMYVTSGGRKTQSGLYRISWTRAIEDESSDIVASRSRALEDSRSIRESLASIADPELLSSSDGPFIAEYVLISPSYSRDPFMGRAAQVALEQLAPEGWLSWNHHGPLDGARVCIGAIHADALGAQDEIVRRILDAELTRATSGQLVEFLRVIGMVAVRCAPLDVATHEALRMKVEEVGYPTSSLRLDRELLQVLVALESPKALEPAVALLESDAPQEEKIWGAYCLRCAKVGWTRELRERYFDALDGLRGTAKGGHSLAKYLDEIREQSVEALTEDEKAELGERVEPPKTLTGAPGRPAIAFVRAWKREELAPLLVQALQERSFERGRTAFAKASCVDCHRIAGEGGSTGPDLTGAGSRFGRGDLLDALLEPSKTISDQYQDTEVLTLDGDLFVGRVEGEEDGVLKLRRLPPQDDVVEIELAQIERRRLHPTSRMPSGLLDVLEQDEILDLFAYLLAGANPDDPQFAR